MIILDSLMESRIQDKVQLQTQINMDMQMLITLGSATERTEKEREKLFVDAGFKLPSISSLGARCLIEVYPQIEEHLLL